MSALDRILSLCVLATALGCATGKSVTVLVPRTLEAQACQRECLMLDQACRNNVRYVTFNGRLIPVEPRGCGDAFVQCALTCPGACVQKPDKRECDTGKR